MTYCQSITQIFRIIWVRCIPLVWDQRHDGEQHLCFLLDFFLSIESDGQLCTSFYEKRDNFNFHRTNFPFLNSNIPSSPAYSVFISQLVRYARACSPYECFILRAAGRNMSWNVWNRPSGSFMVDMGISSNIMKSPSPECYMTLWDMTIYNDTLNWSDFTPIFELINELDFITDFDLITKFWRFP